MSSPPPQVPEEPSQATAPTIEQRMELFKKHIASQDATIAFLEMNSGLKSDIIDNLQRNIVEKDKQLADLEESNTLHKQIEETQREMIVELKLNLVELDAQLALAKKKARGKKGGKGKGKGKVVLDQDAGWPLRNNLSDANEEDDDENDGTCVAGPSGTNNASKTGVLVENVGMRNLILLSDRNAQDAQDSKANQDQETDGGKENAFVAGWRSLRSYSQSFSMPK